MAEINWEDVIGRMLQAAANSLKGDWPRVRSVMERDLRDIADDAKDIERDYAAGKLDEQTAKRYRQIVNNKAKTLEALIRGMVKLSAERAVNSALMVLRATVNTLVGWAVL